VAVVGDVHGHLQLALCMLARLAREESLALDAVFLCGDVGTFTADAQLDNATRRHARTNPCELEFLWQWATDPPAPWLDGIFQSAREGGLGLDCPVVMVHGNHEGFAHLEELTRELPAQPVSVCDLPAVDPCGRIRWLQSGWCLRLDTGHVVGAVGGIERSQRPVDYHPLAFIWDEPVLRLAYAERLDLVVTHQGPSRVQGEHGSVTLDLLLKERVIPLWCHGHSRPQTDITRIEGTEVVPLGDIAFAGPARDDPGEEAIAIVELTPVLACTRFSALPFWREYRRHRWTSTDRGLVSPDLAHLVRRRS
jgi:hypothetical protein